jgi:tetratricopeptide (TPR) repeat protein
MTIEALLLAIVVILLAMLIVLVIQATATVSWNRAMLDLAAQRSEKPHADLQRLLERREYSKIDSEVSEKRMANAEDAALYWYKGLALFYLNRWEEAGTVIRRAIELDPSYEDALKPYLKRIVDRRAKDA